jgi:ABC-type sulfate transport system permease component
VERWLEQLGRGFVFGFAAAVGASVALVLLSLLLLAVLRPWG